MIESLIPFLAKAAVIWFVLEAVAAVIALVFVVGITAWALWSTK